MVAEQNVICSLPGYKYQIAPLARGYTCAVAGCTFILAKRVFSAVSTIVFFGTTRPANGFRRARPFREAAAWYQNCTRNNVQGFVWIGTDSGIYVAHPTRSRLLGGYFASADKVVSGILFGHERQNAAFLPLNLARA